MTIADDKRACRREVKARIKALTTEYVETASAAIAERFLSTPECIQANTIMCYLSYGKEVSTDFLVKDLLKTGKRICIPLCTDVSAHIMEAKLLTEDTEFVEGAYGIREPKASEPTVAPEEIDCIITPCVACGRDRRRLGHGAGYYDRYFEGLDCSKLAFCFEEILTDNIPVDEYDVPVDAVITETTIYR